MKIYELSSGLLVLILYGYHEDASTPKAPIGVLSCITNPPFYLIFCITDAEDIPR